MHLFQKGHFNFNPVKYFSEIGFSAEENHDTATEQWNKTKVIENDKKS